MNFFALVLCAASVAATPIAQQHKPGIQRFLSTWDASPLASYPTDLTRGIIPKRIHSHNDYWRDVPLYEALSFGAISVEADVWLYNSTLFVGHDTSSLTANRTLQSLYIDPLVSILEAQNPSTPFAPEKTYNGVFDTTAEQTLYFWIELKTSGEETLPHVISALQPLRERGYLTTVNNNTITPGPITVIGTGNTPLDLVAPVTKRDYFFDGPWMALAENNITAAISPIASCQLSAAVGEVGAEGLNGTQMEIVKELVKKANERGIEGRFWDLPAWPLKTRNKVWEQVMDLGVYLLNADDLRAAAATRW